MTHFNLTLTDEIELSAKKSKRWERETITTDGGHEVRNTRWSTPLVEFECSLPSCSTDDARYLSLLDIWETTEGGTHTFNFRDWTDKSGGTVVKVRFDEPLEISAVSTTLVHVDSFILKEVR